MSVVLMDYQKVAQVSRSLEDVVDEDGGELLEPYVDPEGQIAWVCANVPLIDLYKTSLNSFAQALAIADELDISTMEEEAGLHIKIGIKCQQLGEKRCNE